MQGERERTLEALKEEDRHSTLSNTTFLRTIRGVARNLAMGGGQKF